MDTEFLFDVDRVKLGLENRRDDYRRSGEPTKASVFVRAISAIDDVRANLKQKIKNEKKPATDVRNTGQVHQAEIK